MKPSSVWSQVAAAELLARRSTQVTWMRTSSFSKCIEDFLDQHEAGQHIKEAEERAHLMRALVDHWTLGERFVVSPAAAAAIYSAAAALDGDVLPPLMPTDLLAPSAVVVLPRSIYGSSEAGQRLGVSAFSWGPCYTSPGVEGTFQVTWTHHEAEDDSQVKALRSARRGMRQIVSQAEKEVALLRQTLKNDEDVSEEERSALRNLLDQRQQEVTRTGRAAARLEQSGGEYLPRDMQPIPFMHEFAVRAGAERSLREQKTTSLDAVDPDARSLVSRIPYAFWGLVEQGLLTLTTVGLTPKVERKYGRKRMASSVIAVDAPPDLVKGNLVTATKVRVVRDGEDVAVRDGFQWDLSTPIGGRVL